MSRTPQGEAEGTLAGPWSNPALRHPCAAGYALFDDFHWIGSPSTRPGLLDWEQTTIGTAPTHSSSLGTATALGIRQISTSLTANTGGHVRSSETLWQGLPGIGADWQVKIRMTSDMTTSTIWSGFISSVSVVPLTANNVQFYGVRSVDGGNWHGVTKTGSGAGKETAIDLGFTPGDWGVPGFEIWDGGGGAKRVYWYRDYLDDRRQMRRLYIGGLVSTHLTFGVSLFASALGIVNSAAVERVGQVDWWSLGGRVARL